MTLQLRSEAQEANKEAKGEVQEGCSRQCHTVMSWREEGGGLQATRGSQLVGSQREASGGRKGLEEAGPSEPMTNAPLLVILVYYSENNGKTFCFGEIVLAASWRVD